MRLPASDWRSQLVAACFATFFAMVFEGIVQTNLLHGYISLTSFQVLFFGFWVAGTTML